MSEKPTVYKCLNDDCSYHKRMKEKKGKDWRNILGVGIIKGESFIIFKCKECGQELRVNMDEQVDKTAVNVAELLMRPRANA